MSFKGNKANAREYEERSILPDDRTLLSSQLFTSRLFPTSSFAPDRLTEISPFLASTWLIRKRHIITGAELALLLLNKRIIEMHIVLDGRNILMPQQFL